MTDLAHRPLTRRRLLAGGGALALGMAFGARDGRAGEDPVVRFLNWEDYIGETTFADFKAGTGIGVDFTPFRNNQEMFDAVSRPDHGYDVIVPTNEFVGRLMADDLLMPLDESALPNKRNIQQQFSDALFDPGRRFSIPYVWGTLGIAYRRSAVAEPPGSWRWLFRENRFNGRIALYDEPSHVLGCALRYLGLPVNTADPAHIEAAERLLVRQKPNIRIVGPVAANKLLLSGEADLILAYSGVMQSLIAQDPDLGYIIPREGSILSQDSLCIPRGAPHPANAHAFINFILDARNGAKIARSLNLPVANRAALRLMPRSYRYNLVIFPSEIVLASCKVRVYQGPDVAAMYQAAWDRIRRA
ncbi:MAG: PotD/PotF family extracellular solute-binding protein [Alphaproteobacteria bacterium]